MNDKAKVLLPLSSVPLHTQLRDLLRGRNLAAVERLKQHGYPVLDEDLARLSPLIFEHINMLGRYSFAVPEEVARGELRPLRNPDDDL
jgi:hypothetical protein